MGAWLLFSLPYGFFCDVEEVFQDIVAWLLGKIMSVVIFF